MRFGTAIAAAIGFLSASFPFVATASLINAGTYMSDTSTGLDWLDLTASLDMSYDYVSSQLGPGGAFAGWQYATVAQVETLWTDAEILPGTPEACTPAPCLARYVSTAAVLNLTTYSARRGQLLMGSLVKSG